MKLKPFNFPPPEQKRSNFVALLASFMLVICSAFFGILYDLPHVFFIVTIIALGSFSRKKSFLVNRRTIIYSFFIAIVLSMLGNLIFPFENERFGLFVMLVKSETSIPFALYLASISLYFWYPKMWGGVVTGAAIFAVGGFADVIRYDITGVRIDWKWVGKEAIYKPLFFSLTAILAFLGILIIIYAESVKKGKRKLRFIITVSTLLLVGVTWVSAWMTYEHYSEEIRRWENKRLYFVGQNKMLRNLGSYDFSGKDIDLKMPFINHNSAIESNILLRVDGKRAPGYLRAKTFNSYDNGVWRGSSKKGGVILKSEVMPDLASSYYEQEEAGSDNKEEWQVFWASGFKHDVLPVVANWHRLELITDTLNVDFDGEVVAADWIRRGGYKMIASDYFPESAWNMNYPLERYLQLPEDLRFCLNDTVKNLKIGENDNFDLKTAKIVKYFSDNFLYEIGNIPQGEEPVKYFLTKSNKGHCELFASATVLLARELGIPARYVTGFMCYEKHPSGNYYVSRVANAHAWTELYDSVRGQWMLIDSTPANELPDFSESWNYASSLKDQLEHIWSKVMSALQRGEMARVLKQTLFSVYGLSIIIVGGAVFLIIFIRRRTKTKDFSYSIDKKQKEWSDKFIAWQKESAEKGGFEIYSGMSAEETLDAISKSVDFSEAEKKQAQEFINKYYFGRFSHFE